MSEALSRTLAVAPLRPNHLLELVDHKVVPAVDSVMPPLEVLRSTEFEAPQIIRPGVVRDFAGLAERRSDIQLLKLLPVKSNEVHARYHNQNHPGLLEELRKAMGESQLMLAANAFPYDLPPDVHQSILWYEGSTERRTWVTTFLSWIMYAFHLAEQDVIVFERPINEETKNLKYVRGSFRHLNHLHLWTKR